MYIGASFPSLAAIFNAILADTRRLSGSPVYPLSFVFASTFSIGGIKLVCPNVHVDRGLSWIPLDRYSGQCWQLRSSYVPKRVVSIPSRGINTNLRLPHLEGIQALPLEELVVEVSNNATEQDFERMVPATVKQQHAIL
jgi:hypothetical protein